MHNHKANRGKADDIFKGSKDPIELEKNILIYVRGGIVFSGENWQVKASETLEKGYGTCYNKNLLMIALMRY